MMSPRHIEASGHLGGRDGPEVVALDVVGVLLELGEVSGRHHGLGEHHGGRPHLFERVGVAVEGERGQCPEQSRTETAVEREHRSRELRPPLHVQQAQVHADLPVGYPLGLGVDGFGIGPRPGHHVVLGSVPVRGIRRREIGQDRGGPGERRAGRRRPRQLRARSSSPTCRLRAASSSAAAGSPPRRASPTCLERDLTSARSSSRRPMALRAASSSSTRWSTSAGATPRRPRAAFTEPLSSLTMRISIMTMTTVA